jgi:hypothetical protein
MIINEQDLAEIESATLSGVAVGVGSQVLIFGERDSIIVQCDFIVEGAGDVRYGHGEQAEKSLLLFVFLNSRVLHASINNDKSLVLEFEGSKTLILVPERNGLESYVLATRLGICPVVLE